MAKCTNVTYLMHEKADAPGTFEKLIDITEYPDLGGEKENSMLQHFPIRRKEPLTVSRTQGVLLSKHGMRKLITRNSWICRKQEKLINTSYGLEKRVLTANGSGPVLWQYIRQADLPTMREKCHSPLLMRAKRLFIM